MEVKYPDVTVELLGQDGNVFGIIGKVSKALRREVDAEAAAEFRSAAMSSESYDEVLQLVMRTVDVE